MAWSTRELADLAGTTVNTVRHYHRLGLLDEPERRVNGYKQYGVRDLVCLLRIRRLVDLGVPLAQIGDVSGGATDRELLGTLDAELGAQIDRLTKAREELAAIVRDDAPADSPAGFSSVASQLSEADNSILHVFGRLYDSDALTDIQRMVEDDLATNPVSGEVDALAPDADDATRQRLSEAMAPFLARQMREYPWLSEPGAQMVGRPADTGQTIADAMVELYNPAQLDVFVRAGVLARELLAKEEDTS
ncbi:MerR family transcriptional regulator [Microcella sp.]|uniref:MerR family transcriptional regulator n=1 Tax=Microcella sp. TaxID=1913979 RepID=UPI0025670037|nr:MerR family transcriptional regulator [Microcella sp.]MBX9472984.1 MerR family transcriptional regulator [Microcella sp.]